MKLDREELTLRACDRPNSGLSRSTIHKDLPGRHQRVNQLDLKLELSCILAHTSTLQLPSLIPSANLLPTELANFRQSPWLLRPRHDPTSKAKRWPAQVQE